MVSDKMAVICPDFIWLGCLISDPIWNPEHLQTNLVSTILISDPYCSPVFEARSTAKLKSKKSKLTRIEVKVWKARHVSRNWSFNSAASEAVEVILLLLLLSGSRVEVVHELRIGRSSGNDLVKWQGRHSDGKQQGLRLALYKHFISFFFNVDSP